jgi:pimeloyl-ACP methyl ester carboxylesterase/quercetin dioxygenase-like cupin family protein
MRMSCNGAEIHYTDDGAGPPIVLLHGGLATGAVQWEPHLPAFLDGHRVIVADTRGHGASTNPAGQLSYELLADDWAAFITELGLERPLVVGYSDGGQAALDMAVRHPGVAGALAIGGVILEPTEQYRVFVSYLGMDVPGEPDVAQLESAMPGIADAVREQHGDRWQELLVETTHLWASLPVYTDEQLAGIGVPTLVITGETDEPSATHARRIASTVPGGELAVIPGTGHEAVASTLFGAMVLDFAERIGRPAASTFQQVDGRDVGGHASYFLVTNRVRGTGPRLHRHTYEEMFVVRGGEAEFVLDGARRPGRAGDVVVVPAGVAHRFVNTGRAPLEMVNIHLADAVVTEWLE